MYLGQVREAFNPIFFVQPSFAACLVGRNDTCLYGDVKLSWLLSVELETRA
jgi:hypothetical protein